MNSDRFIGAAQRFTGTLQCLAGRLLRSEPLYAAGRVCHANGLLREALGQAKNALRLGAK